MGKVTANRGRGDIDELDGKALVDGEKLKVKFPDGKTKKVKVVLHESIEFGTECRKTYTIPISKAHFVLDYHGWELDFPLEGLEAKRIE